MISRMQTRAYVDVGAGVGVEVGAEVGVDVGAGVGVEVGDGVGEGVGLSTNNKLLHVSNRPERLAWRQIDAPWRRR